jgi:hypothetical protein
MQKVRSRVGNGDDEHNEQQFLRDPGHSWVMAKGLPEDFEDYRIARSDRYRLAIPLKRWVKIWTRFIAKDTKKFDEEDASEIGVKERIFCQQGCPQTTKDDRTFESDHTQPNEVRVHGDWAVVGGKYYHGSTRKMPAPSSCLLYHFLDS